MKLLFSTLASLLLIVSFGTYSFQPRITFSCTRHTQNQYHLIVTFHLKAKDYLYKELLTFALDQPHVQLSDYTSSVKEQTIYDTLFNTNKTVYKGPVTFTMEATFLQPGNHDVETYLHVTAYTRRHQQFTTHIFKLETTAHLQVPLFESQSVSTPQATSQPLLLTCGPKKPRAWSDYFSHMLESNSSLWLKGAFAFALGILMSLTPCIYPMIPITAGIMQTHAGSSLLASLSLSGAYTIGLATTFATFGLIAAHTGQFFNKLFHTPFIIILLVALLMYLGLSMLGLYQMYIPSFLYAGNKRVMSGSLVSAFLFGALSGTIASPCLSPGLVLLLSIVLTIGNKFIGFMLLFFFGIGIGIPLLIIGSCSSALQLFPHAGHWMVEIKRIFGMLLIGSCLYLLQPLVHVQVLFCAATIGLFTMGIFFLIRSQRITKSLLLSLLAGICFVLAVLCAFKTYQAFYPLEHPCRKNSLWQTDYQCALKQAHKERKKVIVDISAPNCSLCTAIEQHVLLNPTVATELQHFVLVKIDSSDDKNKQCTALQQQYTIVGVPTILVIDPETEQQLARWHGELYTTPIEQFIAQLASLR